MGLKEKLQQDFIVAMKSKSELRVAVLRQLRGQIRQAEIDGRKELDESEVLVVLSKVAKQHRDSIKAYAEGARQDLVDREQAELDIIESYLPKPLDEAEINRLIDKVIAEVGAAGMKDIGKVMGVLMPQVKGRTDGARVQAIVKSKLA
jgi:uncharacterized protein YqeY